ncbi:hypotheical protein [Halarchaeum acidiphilum MH1-52-1]|uniref:Hypotheical protein n=1 Tax=Halarchaeum acidiphilum MH1-52-1 TaxID=1261545 RepID=U3A0S7_9EURY|nr:hypotheical protein [Halarchaeum acidiphilum MH1-52-1]
MKIGTAVYDEDGNEIGTVRGFNSDGFFVTTRTGVASLSVEHEHTPHDLGEAELLWRCSDCGELGDIADIPDSCPECGAPREHLYYWTED